MPTAAREWFEALSEEERLHLGLYTSPVGGGDQAVVIGATVKGRLPEAATLYRGISSASSVWDDVADLQVGDILNTAESKAPYALATSLDRRLVEMMWTDHGLPGRRAMLLEINVPAGTSAAFPSLLFERNPEEFPNPEQEILLPPGLPLNVVERRKGEITVLRMTAG